MNSIILIVLDGYGIAPPGPGNAVSLANPQNMQSYIRSFPNTTLKASGEMVGLPSSEVGNTEVGHLNLGAGRVVYQDLPRINMSIADGEFYRNNAFMSALLHVKEKGGNLHLMGLIGEGTVHSSLDHLYALLYLAKEQGVMQTCIHVITDGRDSPPKSGGEIISRLEERLKGFGIGKIASVTGRYYAMDRDRRWERTERAYLALTQGIGKTATSPLEVVENAYKIGITDEFIEPTLIVTPESPQPTLIKEGDAVIFFNYRIDRPRQLTKAFVLDDFEANANITTSFDPYAVKYYKTHLPKEEIINPPFKRGEKIKNLHFTTMTEYEKDLPVKVAFPPHQVETPLGKIISEKGCAQLRMSESEKERFVTFYFNGQRDLPFEKEERIIVPSPKISTYDQKPEMAAFELTSILIQKIQEKKYRFILVNFANPDMVGHTGNIEASIRAVEAVDSCVGKIVSESLVLDYAVLITADHGNVEQKINPQTGQISTEHTANSVPFIALHKSLEGKAGKLAPGILADVAPTILFLMDIPQPHEMTGRNLLEGVK